MSLELFICVVFILLRQSVNGAQFLNISFSFLLFGPSAVPGAVLFGTVIVPSTSMYVSL